MKKIIILLVLIIVSYINLQALTLNEALIIAYDNNLSLKSAINNDRLSHFNKMKSAAAFLPSVDLKLQHEYNIDLDRHNSGITLNTSGDFSLQKIHNFKFNSERRQISRLELDANKQKILLEVAKLFMNIITIESKYDVATKRIDIFQKSLEAAEKKQEMGNSTVAEVANFKLNLNMAQIEQLQLNIQITNLKSQLYNMLSNGQQIYKVADKDFVMPEEEDLPQLPTMDIESENLLTKISYKNFQSQNENIKAGNAAFFPVFSIQMTQNFSTKTPTLNAQSTRIIGQVSFNILRNMGMDYIRHKESLAQYHKAKYDYLNQKLKNELDEDLAWSDLRLAKEKIQYVEQAIEAASITLEGVNKEYNFGTKNVLDLLNAQNDYFNTKNKMIEAQKDYIISHYQVLLQYNELTIENIKNCVKNEK